MRSFALIALCSWMFGMGLLNLNAQPVGSRLKEVKTIYVAPLEGHDVVLAAMVHAKLISALAKIQIQGVSIVEDEENADAILTGAGAVQTATTEYGNTHYLIQAGMRLVSKEGGVILWADNVTNSRYARSASSSFAENV